MKPQVLCHECKIYFATGYIAIKDKSVPVCDSCYKILYKIRLEQLEKVKQDEKNFE